MPQRPALAPAPDAGGREQAPTTRDRLRASFDGRAVAISPAPAARLDALERSAGRAAPAGQAPPAELATTRQRIAGRARAAETSVPAQAAEEAAQRAPMAEVIDIATLRARRQERATGAANPPAAVEPQSARSALSMPGAARGPPIAETPPDEPAVIASATEPAATGASPAPATDGAARQAAAEPSGAHETAVPAARAAAATPESGAAATIPGAAAAQPDREALPAPGSKVPAASAPAAQPRAVRNPEDEPGFQAMAQKAGRAAAATRAHQPAAEGAATAQGAATAPENDLESQAAGAQVEVMGDKEPGEFDAQAFIATVKRAVDAATPSTLEDADEFKESGAVGTATAEIGGLVKGGKESSESDIETATQAAPDTSTASPKLVTDMVNDELGPAPPSVGTSAALPGPRPHGQTDLSGGPAQVDAEMATARVTDEQLARSNEPEFSAALDARDQARDHAATAPAVYRSEEETILAQGRAAAGGDAAAQLAGMHGARGGALGQALGTKKDTKSGHEAEHARVANEIQEIYGATKAHVQEILDGLDVKVDDEFKRGEEAARTRFENYVDDRMRAYKADRYGGLGGGALWAWDKLTGMPDEVDEFYVQGRADYLTAMDGVIGGIASTIGSALTAARARIVEGRAAIRAYVESLDESLRAVGEQAEGRLDEQFDALSAEVTAKQDALVDAVARRYVESRDALDARIEDLQAANKGLVAAALDAVVGVIKTILALGEMLLRVLARAAEVVGDIISDPIGFLANLVDGVMGGLNRFVRRIGVHLQNALAQWLFGTLGNAGIRVPEKLDGGGILDLVTQVIGLTYANIRARVARIVGEPVVAQMEQTVDVFKTLASVGVGGLWEFVREKVGDLEKNVLGKLKEWVVERVITGGIAWIIGLLNPVAAFVKACKAIHSIVMFIVERAKQIMEFVDSILDSVSAIAKGNVGAAVEKVEGALAKGLPLAIGFLASLLGLGNITDKVKAIIAAVRRPVEKAIDAIVMGVARTFKRTFGAATGVVKGKVEAGKAWAKGKVEAGREWARKAEPARAAVTSAPAVEVEEDGEATAAEPEAAEGPWIYETTESGHTVRVSPAFEVFSFSKPRKLTGAIAAAVQQQSLESKIPHPAATYPTDALNRAAGPAGFVKGLKDGAARDSIPAVPKLAGGVAAYEPGDVRGHLIGDRFHGPARDGNLVPMHTTLNGSTFLSFESGIANAYKRAKTAGRGALLSMQLTPTYSPDDPAQSGRKYRPNPVDADCTLYALDANGGVSQTSFTGTFPNPSNAAVIINLNSATRTEILAAYSGQLSPEIHQLVDAIVAVRPRRTVEGFMEGLVFRLPANKTYLFQTLLASRAARFVLG